MSEYHERAFIELRAEINEYSPSAANLLEQLKDGSGAQLAYYAAFVIICLKAQQELPAAKSLGSITRNDLKDYTFFEVAKDNDVAIALFDEALALYRIEQAKR